MQQNNYKYLFSFDDKQYLTNLEELYQYATAQMEKETLFLWEIVGWCKKGMVVENWLQNEQTNRESN